MEGPFTSTVLLESPSISHTWRFILTILTLPFSLSTSKGQNFKTFQNVVYSAFFAWWGKPHSGSVTPFEILKYFPYRNFAPGWFLEAGRGQKNQTGRDRDCRYAALSSLIYGLPNSSPPKDLAYIYLDAGNAIKNAVHISIFEGGKAQFPKLIIGAFLENRPSFFDEPHYYTV